MTYWPTGGRPSIGERVQDLVHAVPKDIPRTERRVEVCCVHGAMWKPLAAVGREAFVTALGENPYPADGEVVEVNCMDCRTRWQVSMTRLRERVERRRRLEKVALTEVADVAPWLD